ncbi:MAG TPA: pyridoxamine 5'-phosphate oxidase [Vicinamibacterales bacterium]|nr:pyridoxamine 5'-phosphate oxidase [Vicinamibacterales bacterium]
MTDDPIERFRELFERARQVCSDDPTAMVLATADREGRPSSRFVLLKAVDRGFVFYTNLESRKARDLRERPFAALCIHWAPLGVQVRIEGRVEPVSDEEADAYFASRPREYQISAWASRQSAPLDSLEELDRRVAEMRARFDGRPVPRPPFWSGYRVIPDRIEFWTCRPNRLHERILYERAGDRWTTTRLFP